MDAPSEQTSPFPGPIRSQPQPAAPPLKPEGRVCYPLDSVKLPMLAKRWFNRRSRLRFSYADEAFSFDPDWVKTKATNFLAASCEVLARVSAAASAVVLLLGQKERRSETWKNVKTMKIEQGQLIIATDGANGIGI